MSDITCFGEWACKGRYPSDPWWPHAVADRVLGPWHKPLSNPFQLINVAYYILDTSVFYIPKILSQNWSQKIRTAQGWMYTCIYRGSVRCSQTRSMDRRGLISGLSRTQHLYCWNVISLFTYLKCTI